MCLHTHHINTEKLTKYTHTTKSKRTSVATHTHTHARTHKHTHIRMHTFWIHPPFLYLGINSATLPPPPTPPLCAY